jgi:hypothetical protein
LFSSKLVDVAKINRFHKTLSPKNLAISIVFPPRFINIYIVGLVEVDGEDLAMASMEQVLLLALTD